MSQKESLLKWHEEEKKRKKRTVSRKARLLELYAACKDDVRDWTKEIEDREEREFNSKKLYLYYTQMGRCMYSGEEIDIDELMQKTLNGTLTIFIHNRKLKMIVLIIWF